MLRIFFIISIIFPLSTAAQINGMLTYKQAVGLLLKNNFDIQIAKNNATIADIQNTYGNAGFMPRVDINAGTSIASNKTRQEFASGLSVNQSGVGSQNLNAGAFLTWTIFDGMKMFATKERLNLLEQQGELSMKLEMEQQIEQLTLIYFQIVKHEQSIKGIEATMQVSEERIKLYERKLDIGAGSNVELLQARLDYNAQKSNLLSQKSMLSEYKSNLLVLLKSEANANIEVDTIIEFENVKSLDEIKQKIEQSNLSRDIEIAAGRLRRMRLYTKKLSIFIKERDHKRHWADVELPEYTNYADVMVTYARIAFDTLFSKYQIYKAAGVTCHGLVARENMTASLFADPFHKDSMYQAMDAVTEKFGDYSLVFASSMNAVKSYQKDTSKIVRREKMYPLPYLGEVN
jgi:hypothetical protein